MFVWLRGFLYQQKLRLQKLGRQEHEPQTRAESVFTPKLFKISGSERRLSRIKTTAGKVRNTDDLIIVGVLGGY